MPSDMTGGNKGNSY